MEKQKQSKEKIEKKTEKEKIESGGSIMRILGTDIPENMAVYSGLTRIKGISWAFSNALCNLLNIDKKRKMSTLNEKEHEQIISFIKSPELPEWLLNRRKDIVTGKNIHLITTDLDIQRDFDIRRLKTIKSYRGWRHALGLPVRGQRTRSHFRKGGALGVTKGKAREAMKSTAGKEKGKKEKKK